MRIAMGCSMKYRGYAKAVFNDLSKLGLTPLFPNLFHTEGNKNMAASAADKRKFALEHYRAIDEADLCYWLTPGGHLGTSCKLELGYALAKQKPIYFSEPTNDLALDCYVFEFVPVEKVDRFTQLDVA